MKIYNPYNKNEKDIIVCFLDDTDYCFNNWAKEIINGVSDHTLFQLAYKFPILQSKNLDQMIDYARDKSKLALIVNTGIDVTDVSSIDIDVKDSFSIFSLKDNCSNIKKLYDCSLEKLLSKPFYLDGSNKENFYEGIRWQNYKFISSHSALFYATNNEKIYYDFDLQTIKQFITPAAGLNWLKYLNHYGYNDNTVVKFYDYSYFALECMKDIIEWNGKDYFSFLKYLGNKKFDFLKNNKLSLKIDSGEWEGDGIDRKKIFKFNESIFDNFLDIKSKVKFEYYLIDLIADSKNLLGDLISPEDNTIVNLSNVFNYQCNAPLYNLEMSIKAENEIISSLKKNLPDSYLTFSYRAGEIYYPHTAQVSGKANSFNITDMYSLRLPTWYENN